MKAIVIEKISQPEDFENPGSWYFLADSAVSNTGKPFYLPEFKGAVTVSPAPAVKINRLGKSIQERFASRYYSEVAPAVHFRLPEYRVRLQAKGFSTDPAVSFDRSLMVGEFLPVDEVREMSILINGEEKVLFDTTDLRRETDTSIAMVSRSDTIKMGDYLIPRTFGEIPLKEGDYVEMRVNGEKSFHVKIK